MEKKLSIIIPVYNTRDTLEKTFETAQAQTWPNKEIIFVDDGSPDGAGEICDAIKAKYDNVIVIHKKNQGLGYARNSALEVASGEFIAFLDSDDWLELDTYETCIRALEEEQADMCCYGRKIYTNETDYYHVDTAKDVMLTKGRIVDSEDLPKYTVYKDKDIVEGFVPRYFGDWETSFDDMYIRESCVCALYRASVMRDNNIIFLSERDCLSEDLFFNLEICRVANGVIILHNSYYHKGYNMGSLSRGYNPKRYQKFLDMYNYLCEYSKKYPEIEDAIKRSEFRTIAGIRGTIRDEMALTDQGFWTSYSVVKNMVKNEKMQKLVKDFDIKVPDKNTRTFIGLVRVRMSLIISLIYYMKARRIK